MTAPDPSKQEKKHSHDSDSGYPEKKTDKYPHSRSGYKRGHHHYGGEQHRHRSKGFWPEVQAGITIVCIIGLGLVGHYFSIAINSPPDADEIHSKRVHGREVERHISVYISDNLDCSIYMKQLQMKSVDRRLILLHGLACLYLNEPHSFAPDSAYSLMFHWQQASEALVKSESLGYFEQYSGSCLRSDVKSTSSPLKDNSHCPIWVFPVLGLTVTKLDTARLADVVPSSLLVDLKEEYMNSYLEHFSLLARFQDSGNQTTYPQAELTKNYNVTVEAEEKFHRVFRVSELLSTLYTRYKPELNKWRKDVFPNGSGKESIHTKTTLNITKEVARNLVHHFFYTDEERTDFAERKLFTDMHGPRPGLRYMISWPRGNSSSFIAAFIVQTVYSAMWNCTEKDAELKEAKLLAYFLVAQRIAFEKLPHTCEWTMGSPKNGTKCKHLKFYAENGRKEVENTLRHLDTGGSKYNSVNADKLVTRTDADRVSTLMTWSEVKGESFIFILDAALPKPFWSKYVQDLPTQSTKFAPFKSKAGSSVPVSSSASLVLLETPNNKQFRFTRIMATASGSIRTIEAVAFPVLRYLIFNETPGEAVSAPTAYVSLLDGKPYCEKDRPTKSGKDLKATRILEYLESYYGIRCENVDKTKFEETDRTSYLIVRDGQGSTVEHDLKAAVDERSPSYNYPTGY